MSGAGCPRVTHPFAALPSQGLPLERFPLDLHVLSTPPAIVLSQDQTLRREPSDPAGAGLSGSFGKSALPEGTSGSASCDSEFHYDRQSWRRGEPRLPLDGDAHWLLAHCSVLKVRARTLEARRRRSREGVAQQMMLRVAAVGVNPPPPVARIDAPRSSEATSGSRRGRQALRADITRTRPPVRIDAYPPARPTRSTRSRAR